MTQITEIDDPRIVKGLAHPLRIHIPRVLQECVASPSEIAAESDASLGTISYHVAANHREAEIASTIVLMLFDHGTGLAEPFVAEPAPIGA